jgi:hypothetical protein
MYIYMYFTLLVFLYIYVYACNQMTRINLKVFVTYNEVSFICLFT